MAISINAFSYNTISYAYDQSGRRVGREIILSQNEGERTFPDVNRPSILEELNNLKFTVYPNPTAGAVNLIINSSAEIEGSVTIVNSSGAKINTANLEQRMQFDLESHPRGIYFMVISYGEKSVTYKIIKE